MSFLFYRFRFSFTAIDSLFFPPAKSANIVRGAFGTLFRKAACNPECSSAESCSIRATCPYAKVFEPRAAAGAGPSGLSDWPRPFVFRAAHLDGRVIESGESFHFDAHLFDTNDPALAYFVQAFDALARDGIGPRRGRARLNRVMQIDLDGMEAPDLQSPLELDLAAATHGVQRLQVRFVTPTELKSRQGLTERPEFPVLLARLRDRLSTLRALYGAGPLDIDFRGLAERASQVRMTRCDVRHIDAERRSSRTAQVHSLGGFLGEAEYEGDLDDFVPYLRAGEWVGVGRQTVWGKGELRIAALAVKG
ncbi:MAG: CRISPR system precrRNA processing endoribonuclease RAMP protein Cas6 [Bryobacteraceae bacterium]